MAKIADHDAAVGSDGPIARWRDWWRQQNELGNLPREELERMAGDFGMTGSELEELAAKGPHAADLLYHRMGALGLSRTDMERLAFGFMRDAEKNCSGCNDKAACKKDLAARPDDPVWKSYCPNSVTLEAISKMKGH